MTFPAAAPDECVDSLQVAAEVLDGLADLPLERHPEAFAHCDELLREALESSPPVSSG